MNEEIPVLKPRECKICKVSKPTFLYSGRGQPCNTCYNKKTKKERGSFVNTMCSRWGKRTKRYRPYVPS